MDVARFPPDGVRMPKTVTPVVNKKGQAYGWGHERRWWTWMA